MSRESSKSMKISLKFEWEIEPRERFAQNPPKSVSIRPAGLTMFWECQAGAPNGHDEKPNYRVRRSARNRIGRFLLRPSRAPGYPCRSAATPPRKRFLDQSCRRTVISIPLSGTCFLAA